MIVADTKDTKDTKGGPRRFGFSFVSLVSFVLPQRRRDASADARPKADVTPLTEAAGARGGTTARVALKVSLPEGLHTQSNKPRDPLLIPTELTIDAPAGVTVKRSCFRRRPT